MSTVIEFPGAEREVNEQEVNDRHAEAFRDLEGKISDCTIMAIIAVQMVEPFINTRNDESERALFAVCHVYEMLKKLSADYQAAFYGEQRAGS
jgi:hypothetical protein